MSVHIIIRRAGLLLATAALSGVIAQAQAQTSSSSNASQSGVIRMIANGSDGNTTYYGVKCANGSRGDVRLDHEKRQVCAVAQGGKSSCRAAWPLQQAAEHVCANSSR